MSLEPGFRYDVIFNTIEDWSETQWYTARLLAMAVLLLGLLSATLPKLCSLIPV